MTKHSFLSLLISIIAIPGFQSMWAQAPFQALLNTPANAGILSESCGGPYQLIIERDPSNTDTIIIFVSDFGTAQIGVDYTFAAGAFPIELLPSETTAVIDINVIADALSEGTETLGLELAYQAGTASGVVNLESAITDQYEVTIQSVTDTIEWCRDIPLELSAVSDANISWSPSFLFTPSSGPEVTVRPFGTGWYYATVGTDTCGAKDSIYLLLAEAEIVAPDTLFICNDGDGVVLQGTITGLATTFTWVPSDTTLSDPNILTPVANPTVTTTYILQSDIGVCVAADTVVVRVDSLPEDQHIDIAPLKGYYCAGEIVALFSPAYDSLDFPDIQFSWNPADNTFLTDTTLLNAALELQDTTLYIRKNRNNACISYDSILINVVPSSVPISVTDTTLCPGEMFTVIVENDQVTEPEWTPADGLSCTKCLDPKVTVTGAPGSIITYQFSGKILECPVGASLTVSVPDVQPINITGDQVACPGDILPLTITNPEGLSDFTWEVTFGNASLSCNNCPDPSVTINGNPPVNILLTAATSNPDFCIAQGFFQFVPGESLQVAGPPVFACVGEKAFAVTGFPELTNIVWDVFSGNLNLSCTNCPTTEVTVNSPGQLSFTAESPDPDVCRVFGTVAVNFSPEDVVTLLLTTDTSSNPIAQGQEVMVMLNVNPAPASVTWTINGVETVTSSTQITFTADEELNAVTATFINSRGCEQTITIEFPAVPPTYLIPNAFTPENGDDINDRFRVIIRGNITLEEFRVFNRWGQLVYDGQEGDLDGWDGRFKSEPAPSDTYMYYATLRYPDNRVLVAKGDVLLVR